ncbi:carboxypeptidase B-like [Mya arenaria]|uniref:carboxypeptidase B-like n=1 Tax=Mya arenaria TaxID=6604 RepID=UPI0022DF8B20|nr:carboxypeptidase B-like [Mya arenaria]
MGLNMDFAAVSTVSLVFLVLIPLAFTAGPLTGHSVLRVWPAGEKQVTLLQELLSMRKSLDIWKGPSCATCPVDIRLTPFEYDDVTSSLKENNFKVETMISDIQHVLDSQRRDLKYKPKAAVFDYSKYHTLDEINAWTMNITNVYDSMTSVFNVTKSYEGRSLMGFKISTPSPFARSAFWIEGGIHAREWISPATVIYMVGQMLDRYKIDPDITTLVDSFEWYILPVTNPDGYAYTWQSDKTRLWRKTRSKHGLCYGVDPNRNWDIEWSKSGASKDPCSDTYCGPKAFSEVEVKGVSDFLRNISGLKGFIDFHSYSQLWMSPWGYTKKLPKDFKQQDEGSAAAVDALQKVFGTKYEHGTIANIIYTASGSSADWTYGKIGVKYSYGVELRDTGKYGFLLPADQIIPSGQETLQALIGLAAYIKDNS